VFVAMSEVKIPQVEQEVVRGVGDPRAAPPTDIEDVEITFRSTTGMVTHEHTKQTNGRHRSPNGRHKTTMLMHWSKIDYKQF